MLNRFPRARRAALLSALLIGATTACTDANQAPKVPLALSGANGATNPGTAAADSNQMAGIARASLDSGNALYRAKKYPEALVQYRLASRHAPNDAAPYFGVYMVARVMNNVALADSASVAMKEHGMEPPGGPHGK